MYNKIFTKILDSSIWLEPTPTRIVWITLIAAMDETGYAHFSALENLALRARVTREEADKAIEVLSSPDENSADPEFEGRRIERIPGGFMILNAEKHRGLVTRIIQREQTRLRVAKHRAAHKGEKRAQADLKIEEIFACECCKEPIEKPYQLYVTQDHNHQTGAVRGFICQSCNKVVGLIEANTPTQSKKAELCRKYILRYVTVSNDMYENVTPSEAVTEAETYTEATTTGDKSPASTVPFQGILDLYHSLLPELPKVAKLTKTRQGYIRQRWLEDLPNLENWQHFFNHVRQSDFLMGKSEGTNGRPPFRADLEWLCKPANFVKIAEDKYHV